MNDLDNKIKNQKELEKQLSSFDMTIKDYYKLRRIFLVMFPMYFQDIETWPVFQEPIEKIEESISEILNNINNVNYPEEDVNELEKVKNILLQDIGLGKVLKNIEDEKKKMSLIDFNNIESMGNIKNRKLGRKLEDNLDIDIFMYFLFRLFELKIDRSKTSSSVIDEKDITKRDLYRIIVRVLELSNNLPRVNGTKNKKYTWKDVERKIDKRVYGFVETEDYKSFKNYILEYIDNEIHSGDTNVFLANLKDLLNNAL